MTDLDRRRFLAGMVGLPLAHLARSPVLGPIAPREPARLDLVVRGGRLIDPAQGIDGIRDIGIAAGRIVRVDGEIPADEAGRIIDAGGRIVTPGLIDLHVHVYDGVAQVSIQPDAVGIARGVTTVIDGGSAGATTFPGFREYVVRSARTRVYALLNISAPGMTVPNELSDLRWADPAAAARTIEENRDVIVGIKVRMLAGIPGGGDVEVMQRTREAADDAGVPIMVHIGGQTSPLPRILEFLRPGDVVTHALRRQGSILDARGQVYPEVLEAMERGVHIDIGHGRGNLDFDVAEAVLGMGIKPTTISSDVHRGNVAGPVFDLPTTLSKFMAMGMTLPEVIAAATASAAGVFDLGTELGSLREGAEADLAVFDLEEGEYELVDSGGKRRTARRRLIPHAVLRSGREHGSITR